MRHINNSNKIELRLISKKSSSAILKIFRLIFIFVMVFTLGTFSGQTVSYTTPLLEQSSLKFAVKPVPTRPVAVLSNEVPKTDGVDISWVDPERPVIALTFDDGPSKGPSSHRIYKYLADNEIHATFFLLGLHLNGKEDRIPLILESGSQIANHTYHHYDLTKRSVEEIKHEEKVILDMFKSYGLEDKQYVVRVPYGAFNQTVLDNISAPIIQWNRDSRDWATDNASQSIANLGELQDGDIVLFHDIYNRTAEAIEILIPSLQAKGFQFLTIDEMFAYKQIELLPGTVYYNAQ